MWKIVAKTEAAQVAQHMSISEMVLMNPYFDWKKYLTQKAVFETEQRIFAHYATNKFFLPSNYILKNIKRIAHIKATIVQGNYDILCKPIFAYKVAEKMPKSKLHVVSGFHYQISADMLCEYYPLWKKVIYR